MVKREDVDTSGQLKNKWELHDVGRTYYYNKKTKKILFEKPTIENWQETPPPDMANGGPPSQQQPPISKTYSYCKCGEESEKYSQTKKQVWEAYNADSAKFVWMEGISNWKPINDLFWDDEIYFWRLTTHVRRLLTIPETKPEIETDPAINSKVRLTPRSRRRLLHRNPLIDRFIRESLRCQTS